MTVVSLLRCDEYNHLAIKDKILRGFSHIGIHIMDAIIGMEGEGPGSAGDPKKIGALLISEDAVAAWSA